MAQYDFSTWYNEIADMPTLAEDGTWYDLETGLPWIMPASKVAKVPKPPVWARRQAEVCANTSEEAKYVSGHLFSSHPSYREDFWKNNAKRSIIFLFEKLSEYDKFLSLADQAHKEGLIVFRNSLRKRARFLKTQILQGIY